MSSYVMLGFWWAASIAIVILAFLQKFSSKLPQVFKDLVTYGKLYTDRKEWSIAQIIEVPKRWFLHFYMTGAVVNSLALYLVIRLFFYNIPLPSFILQLLELLDSNRQVSTDGLSCVILVGLMLFQNVRRLLECLFVSVYSRGSMNLVHYLLGIILYSTFFLTVLVEAPRNVPSSRTGSITDQLLFRHVFGVLVFIAASWQHHTIHRQFASFRQNAKGEVVTLEHTMPHGGLFEYVSCPHFFMEILIYVSFFIVSGFQHATLFSIVMFVVTNQVTAGVITHQWYKNAYKKKYPADRMAVIPYLL